MSSFADTFAAENDEKLATYRENIPNFDPTIAHLAGSIQNIRSTLQDISKANENLKECCEATCANCLPLNLNSLLGIKTENNRNEEAPTKIIHGDEKTEVAKQNDKTNLETEKTEDNEVRFVAQVSDQEFKTIPKYQLGRLTRDNLNEIVQKMDEFLMKKNQIFGKSNKQLTRIDRELLDNWKELELKARGRLQTTLFFVEADIRPLLQERLRPTFSKAIPCLRHIRRIREERCGPLTFYYKGE
ncbi:hypothetical protein CAEBREN_04825 [Caenorhabditis brenneri]|uniref:SKA complex subunit 1 n=1 Tax=Caenorhabditis brenneri TaxID=135651 RepID=G0PH49_CAEBE|nr:hypothetical protein CAEBREN_04825 [Caenorhabditis brenneri]